MARANPLFNPSIFDTMPNLSPRLDDEQINGVPSRGTGLKGEIYMPAYGSNITSLKAALALIDAGKPTLKFTSTVPSYSSRYSETTVTELLGDDADSLNGDGTVHEFGPSAMKLSGFIYIPEGVHEIAVTSDDGFQLKLGGKKIIEYEGVRSADETARTIDFKGGLYAIEITWFDAWGSMELGMEIDGLPVQASAFYRSVSDFTSPPAGTPTIDAEDYHPSYDLGPAALGGDETIEGGNGDDSLDGQGGDDTVFGKGGSDTLLGSYGDDLLVGGAGQDVLDGGRGSDWLRGGDGDDLLISRSDAGIPRIGQLAIDNPTRPDPDGEVNMARQILYGYESQPLVADDILEGGNGRDTFLISPQINAKLEIIRKHTRDDGSINWAGVAGENKELHDHWVDGFGIDIIADYVKGEDRIVIVGHTASICDISYRDTDRDGDMETIVTIASDQSGGCVTGAHTCNCLDKQARSGGAHDLDLLGQLIIHGDMVTLEDIEVDAGATFGIVDTIDEVAEAVFPDGESKVTEIDGKTFYGYDSRTDAPKFGKILDRPEKYSDNPWLKKFTDGAPGQMNEDYGRLAPRGTVEAKGQAVSGTADDDLIVMEANTKASEKLPDAIAFWRFYGESNRFADKQGGAPVHAYEAIESQAHLRAGGGHEGPTGFPNAMYFNGETDFAFAAHHAAQQVSQGTITIWVRPDNLDETGIFLSKDEDGAGDGGHFRLGHSKGGSLVMRFAAGDGGGNRAWLSAPGLLEEGEWSHLAVSFTEDGITVFVDGAEVPRGFWRAIEGGDQAPADYTRAYLTNNEEPWVLGADTKNAAFNDTAAQFAAQDDDLVNPFEGALADFGIWGGFTADDALNGAQVRNLIKNGPAKALDGPGASAPMSAADDTINGGAGDDTIDGGAGDDVIDGGAGDDELSGGYGDDVVRGGAGNDIIDGGRGADLLIGGDGDDMLISRADGGEGRAGQLVMGAPGRPFETIDPATLTTWGAAQPISADDVLVGGKGRDHFYFELGINATRDIIMEHVNEDRTINWGRVAGENDNVHDHWVDTLGIDVIADYNADEDFISIVGHTANISIDYAPKDADGDGVAESIVSLVTVYSMQHGNGGAHDKDLLGYVVVHGDMVTEESIWTNSNVTFGVVETIDELHEAVAPTGTPRADVSGYQGYDTRDIKGNPIGNDPGAHVQNPHLGKVEMSSRGATDFASLDVLTSHAGGTFNKLTSEAIYLAHLADQAREEGTWALSFNADAPGGSNQFLLSKDYSGRKDGGHLSIWIGRDSKLYVRLEGVDSDEWLRMDEVVEAGRDYNIAFTFSNEEIRLFVNGQEVDRDDAVPGGMTGNAEHTVIGASTMSRHSQSDNLRDAFDGTISDVRFYDRAINDAEAMFLQTDIASEASIAFRVDGSAKADRLTGTATEDVLDGGAGADLMQARGGNDMVLGRDGRDTLDGGKGHDLLAGQSGRDSLNGSSGNDTLEGGEGADTLNGGDGRDRLYGGEEDDRLFGGAGDDRLGGDGGDDTLRGEDGADALDGGEGSDLLRGGKGNDELEGGGGHDVLRGEAGKDTLSGGSGSDTLEGGSGNDRLTGGSQGDVFVFSGGIGRDVVTDFSPDKTVRGPHDVLQLDLAKGEANTFAKFISMSRQVGDHVVYDKGGDGKNVIRLLDVQLDSLSATDFDFV